MAAAATTIDPSGRTPRPPGLPGPGNDTKRAGAGNIDSATVPFPATVSIAPVSIFEGDSGSRSAVFTVSLSAPSPQAVTVDYGTSDGTATSPSDYTATSGTLTFNPGDLTKTVTVAVVGDTSDEPDEDFSVRLSNPVNATLNRSLASGIILDDDQPTVLVAADLPAPNHNAWVGANPPPDRVILHGLPVSEDATAQKMVAPSSLHCGARDPTIRFGVATSPADFAPRFFHASTTRDSPS